MSAVRPDDSGAIAMGWFALVTGGSPMPHETPLPASAMETLGAFVALSLAEARELLVLVSDDAALAKIAGAIDLSIRPLCLVLPQADFAAGIAQRATLSLLRSRLWRDGDECRTAAWQAQRLRLEAATGLWQQAQEWIAGPPGKEPPPGLSALFPALVLPIAVWQRMPSRPGAITLLYCCDAPSGLDVFDGRLLRVGQPASRAAGRTLAPADETTRLLLERTRLTQDIADLELELAGVQAELEEFMRDYYRRVGALMAEHDALAASRADRAAMESPADPQLREEAEIRRKQAGESAAESSRFAGPTAEDAETVRPDREARQLFRRLAQQIHPDRAMDESDRAWRTQLMSEANRAYRCGDSAALREIASLWQEQAPARRSTGSPGTTLLHAQLQRLRARLFRIESELHRLFGSRLYELFIAARQARRQDRDLLGEMAIRLQAAIDELRRSPA